MKLINFTLAKPTENFCASFEIEQGALDNIVVTVDNWGDILSAETKDGKAAILNVAVANYISTYWRDIAERGSFGVYKNEVEI